MPEFCPDPMPELTPWDISKVERMTAWLSTEPVASDLSHERSLTSLVSKLKQLGLDRHDMYCVALAAGEILRIPIELNSGPYSYENGFYLVKLGVLALSGGITPLNYGMALPFQ